MANCSYSDLSIWWTFFCKINGEQLSECMANDNVYAFKQKLQTFFCDFEHDRFPVLTDFLMRWVAILMNVRCLYYLMKCVNILKISVILRIRIFQMIKVSCCKFMPGYKIHSKSRPVDCDVTVRKAGWCGCTVCFAASRMKPALAHVGVSTPQWSVHSDQEKLQHAPPLSSVSVCGCTCFMNFSHSHILQHMQRRARYENLIVLSEARYWRGL